MNIISNWIKSIFLCEEIYVGDLVILKDRYNVLRSGCNVYDYAIVVQLEPFVLISELGDIRWNQFSKNDCKVIGKAHGATMKICIDRLKRGL